ncbi:MAG: DUF4328 domain-containing protein [Pyrinomonadaceae bacterium]
MANTFKNDVYRPETGLGVVTCINLGLIAALGVLAVIGSSWRLISPDSSIELGDSAMHPADVIIGLAALFQFGLRFTCAVVFFFWLHRVYNNLPVIGSRNLEFSPGWAVGWWFIPFANLIQPFKIVKELYIESRNRANEADDDYSAENIWLWWIAFLLGGFVLRISDLMIGSGNQPDSKYFPVAFLVGQIFFIVSASFAIVIIRQVVSWQNSAFARTQSAGSMPPPPPPTFEQND